MARILIEGYESGHLWFWDYISGADCVSNGYFIGASGLGMTGNYAFRHNGNAITMKIFLWF